MREGIGPTKRNLMTTKRPLYLVTDSNTDKVLKRCYLANAAIHVKGETTIYILEDGICKGVVWDSDGYAYEYRDSDMSCVGKTEEELLEAHRG